MEIGSIGLAYVAGLLTVLSPCVLPLLPIVLGAAASEHRLGPLALAGGMALSFTVIGLFVATIGFSIGLDADFFRAVAAILLVAIGVVLLVPNVQTRLAVAAGPVGNWTEQRFGGFATAGLRGQFGVGLLLGAVWVPCVGPTLGAASLLRHVCIGYMPAQVGKAGILLCLGRRNL
jgi:cytochrome c biogenesis protein CcdA